MNYLIIFLSYLLVGITIYLLSVYSFTSFVKPVTATIYDSLATDQIGSLGVCWYNPDLTYNQIITKFPNGCHKMLPGITTNTYVGHKFLIVPYDNTFIDSNKNTITNNFDYKCITIANNITTYNVRDQIREFDWSVEYIMTNFDFYVIWNQILIYRRHISQLYALILLTLCLFSSSSSASKILSKGNDIKASKPQNSVYLLISRHQLKCIAVLTMILNHIGHNMKISEYDNDSPNSTAAIVGMYFKPYWTFLADAGWSSQLFAWLTGYNISTTNKSSGILLVVVFLFLEQYIHLPSPITYETLISMVTFRLILSYDYMTINRNTNRCLFSELSILYHSLLCIIVITLISDIIGANGLKLINISGLLYAISGRLFAVNVNFSIELILKSLIWLVAASYIEYNGIRSSLKLFEEYSISYYIYIIIYGLSLLFQVILLSIPHKQQPFSSKGNKLTYMISRYSLEIYVIHFLILLSYNKFIRHDL